MSYQYSGPAVSPYPSIEGGAPPGGRARKTGVASVVVGVVGMVLAAVPIPTGSLVATALLMFVGGPTMGLVGLLCGLHHKRKLPGSSLADAGIALSLCSFVFAVANLILAAVGVLLLVALISAIKDLK